jgi:hypothetical protein
MSRCVKSVLKQQRKVKWNILSGFVANRDGLLTLFFWIF